MQPRVLILNERDPRHPKAGGAETHVYEIFSRLARRGFEVTHFSAGFAEGATSEVVSDVQVERLGSLALYYPRVLQRTARETRRDRFDVVVECLNKVPYYAPLYSARPVLALCHHLFGEVAFQQVSIPIAATVWASERLIPAFYKRCEFLAISESTARDLVARGIDPQHIQVSQPGIDRPAREPNLAQNPKQQVVYVGRLEAYKKVDVLLRAMKRLNEKWPQVEIVIVGRGPARPGLENLAETLGLSHRTRFAGFVTIDERDAILADSRVCVCPSEKEGWGLTVIEANASGTPVVATDADGLRDSVRDGETGFLVADEDVEGFAHAIDRLLGDDALSARMARSALDWSRTFDWEKAADDMAEAIARTRRVP